MIVNQIVFVLVAHSLLQVYLLQKGRDELNTKTLPRIQRQLSPSQNHLIVCWKNYYATFDPYEYTELILSLGKSARRKIAEVLAAPEAGLLCPPPGAASKPSTPPSSTDPGGSERSARV